MIIKRTLFISCLAILGVIISKGDQPAHSAATIIKCSGQIPNKTACLIDAISIKANIYRVDLCTESPFPNYRSSADYAGANCISIFNNNGKLYRGVFEKGNRYILPEKGRDFIKKGTYKYLTIVFENRFKSSGKYTSGKETWSTTASVNKKTNNKILNSNKSRPQEFTSKLSNWRGKINKDNDYCDNNGGTYSRCEVNYNGYELTGIGLGNNFIESYGSNVSYMFYMQKLISPINLKEGMDLEFYLIDNNGLEVYGNGKEVKSITIAPFIFKITYSKKKIS
tara:strand:- start:730 stop:1572 length:843 start_codon:yes stop_codon:yes gene_type:complete